MKFQGKGYYEYVHSKLNESLADMLEEPLEMDETMEIAHEIIREIAEERVLTQRDEVMQTQHIAYSVVLGTWTGTMGYIILSELINKVHLPLDVWLNMHTYLEKAPLFVAGIVGCAVAVGNYYSMKRASKRANDEMLDQYHKLVPKLREGKVLYSPQRISVNGVGYQICYDIRLRSALSDKSIEVFDETAKIIKKIHGRSSVVIGLTSAGIGYLFDQAALGIGVGAAYAALDYTINATNILKQPYYKRKIDEGIQKIVNEYTPEPPKVA